MMDPQAIERARIEMLSVYGCGDMAAFLLGSGFDELLNRLGKHVSCFEQGSAAELSRLKDYLVDLPADWETRRFNKKLEAK